MFKEFLIVNQIIVRIGLMGGKARGQQERLNVIEKTDCGKKSLAAFLCACVCAWIVYVSMCVVCMRSTTEQKKKSLIS